MKPSKPSTLQETKPVQVNPFPTDLWADFGAQASKNKQTRPIALAEAIRDYLEKYRKKENKK